MKRICVLAMVFTLGCGDDSADGGPDGAMARDMSASDAFTPVDRGVVDRPDASPPACRDIADARGWSLCQEGGGRCDIVFEDGAGCAEVCAAVGLPCEQSFEDQLGMCLPNEDEPALGCADTGHTSDYCRCGGELVDAGVADRGVVDSGIGDAGVTMDRGVEDGGVVTDRNYERLLDELVGFGSATTGGFGGELVTVTTLADSGPGSLREAATAEGVAWIRFAVSGVIALESDILVRSDKTIDGRGADVTITRHGLLVQNGEGNVILNNLRMRDSADDLIRFFNGGANMWVHHCDLSNGGDGAFDATEGVTGVTVSYTHIFNHDKAMLVGAGSNDGDGERMRWTGHHNWYERVVQRMPFIRFGRAHSYNNLIMWISGTAMSTRIAPSQMLVEHNILMPQTNVGHKVVNVNDGAAVRFVGNLERPLPGDEIEFEEVAPESVFTPSYGYELETADDALIERLRAEAGWQDVPWPG